MSSIIKSSGQSALILQNVQTSTKALVEVVSVEWFDQHTFEWQFKHQHKQSEPNTQTQKRPFET